jgi:hypothetical protein
VVVRGGGVMPWWCVTAAGRGQSFTIQLLHKFTAALTMHRGRRKDRMGRWCGFFFFTRKIARVLQREIKKINRGSANNKNKTLWILSFKKTSTPIFKKSWKIYFH